jgi:hypothetical protein
MSRHADTIRLLPLMPVMRPVTTRYMAVLKAKILLPKRNSPV